MSDDVVIRVEGLSKRYGLPLAAALRRGWRRLAGRPADDGPWALRDVNLEVSRGETLGIIGRNGAGKSTLLKVLAGVTPPTRGRVELRGRIFPMIELNAGVHPELTGRENARLLAAVMGLRRREAEAKLPDIEEFCELGEWFDKLVRMYSSGMLARLGFAVAVNVDSDILLVDEVLAVGDIAFQRKCLERIEQMHNSGRTVLFVSHSLRQVERLCDRVLLLDQGAATDPSAPTKAISQYYETANRAILERRGSERQARAFAQVKMADAPVDVVRVRLLGRAGEERQSFETGGPMTIEVVYDARAPVDQPIIGFGISTIEGLHLSGFTNEQAGEEMPLRGRGVFRCTVPSIPYLTGIYTVQLKIKHPNGGVLGGGYGLATFAVQVPGHARLSTDYGLVGVNAQWTPPDGTQT